MNVVVTTIFPPTSGTRTIGEKLSQLGGTLWVVGDVPGPQTYDLPSTTFVDFPAQRTLPFRLAALLPERHYTRKNLGYLLAIREGAEFVVETDDDNIPNERFWAPRESMTSGRVVRDAGWCNVYRHFTSSFIWPRGFPLERIHDTPQPVAFEAEERTAYVVQGLADENPDVDAVYRLTRELPLWFDGDAGSVFLDPGVWCPFNSQNTTFFPPAYPLLYLPSGCSFRMTDIWRSFVAQRCLWAMESGVRFEAASVYQERNAHDLLKDFSDEVTGYLNNEGIRRVLEGLELVPGTDPRTVCGNLRTCYEALVGAGFIPGTELALVDAWVADLLA